MITVKTCIRPKGNFGDAALNSYIVQKMTGRKPHLVSITQPVNKKNYLLSGSILASADAKSVVWGSGFLAERDKMKATPQAILAVRGRLTHMKLLKLDFDCPAVYGDPALLLPLFYKPEIKKKKYLCGVVPHYKDDVITTKYRECHKIDICAGVEEVINEIVSCQTIVTSSLHAMIVADAYNIPAYWHQFDKVKGKGFKFYDYLTVRYQVDLDNFYNACPFVK